MSKFKTMLSMITRNPLATGGVVLLGMHVIMLILNLMNHRFPVFIIQNLVGILFLSVVLLIGYFRKVNYPYIVLLTAVGVWVQIHIAIAMLGIDAGFQNYFFATLATGFFLTFSSKHKNTPLIAKFIESMSLVMYVMSVMHGEKVQPVYHLTEQELFIPHIVNTIFVLITITYFSDCYRNLLKSSVHRLQRAAERDELTKLYNRRGIRYFFDKLQERWERESQPYMVAILDIDDFKEVNDTWGHNEGDKVLAAIADVLTRYADGTTWFCRWGGEEFLVLSQLSKSKSQNLGILNSILADVRKIRIEEKDHVIQVTVTIGCAFSEPDMLIHELINKADNALYRGKSSGKNQVVLAE